MKISYNWLKNYLNLELSAKETAVLLTDIGLEVEGIEEFESIRGGLKGVVIGEVLSKKKHPNADRLAITSVDIGSDNPFQIVCGAPNVAAGQKVPVATVGTVLYDGEESFKIKKSKIRGEVSEGMICGPDEIGLGEETDGIMVLDSNAKIGMPASEHFQLESDFVFDIGLTPNRSDAMGHIGVARDLMTVLNHKGSKLQMCKPSVDEFKIKRTDKTIQVEVKDNILCPRYSALSISGVKVSSSPTWLQNKLKAIGLVPINNVVDITNYVLHETGHPLHAFDISKIEGNRVIVSTVKQKTKFTTLDEQELELTSDDLMINNDNGPMCIAGVYGGLDSGVTNLTTDVFIESAYFNPVCIRNTSKRYGLNTDASFRYERGCDPNLTIYALKRAALLITEICGGEVASEITDIYPNVISHFEVNLSYKKMDDLIGEVIDRNVVKSILRDLEIEIKHETDDALDLFVPPFRADVKREVDVIEEILRIYGFNTVQISSDLRSIIPSNNAICAEDIRNVISDLLSNCGFLEAMNNSLTKAEYSSFITELDVNQNIELINPISQDLNAMRQTLLFSGLQNIAYNYNRKNIDVKLYEFGKTYHKIDGCNVENQHLQLLVSGRLYKENWNSDLDKVNFFFIKEVVEHILSRLGLNNFVSSEGNGWGMSYFLSYKCNHKQLVSFGKVTKDLCDKFNVKSDVYVADFNWDLILEMCNSVTVKYQEFSKFPEVRRDLSLLIDKSVSFETLKIIALKVDSKILRSINLFDVYEGEKLPQGKKSYALSFVMGDSRKTLTDKYVDQLMEKLIKSFKNEVGAEIR